MNDMAERNPYLILGVDFGASREDARRYFAHAARRIRRQGGLWSREDLTWALHEIESLDANPDDTVSIFRVPADPTAFEPIGNGMFQPEPVPLARRTQPAGEEDIAQLIDQAAHSLVWTALAACGRRTDATAVVYHFREEEQNP
jgi:hypothetical protein